MPNGCEGRGSRFEREGRMQLGPRRAGARSKGLQLLRDNYDEADSLSSTQVESMKGLALKRLELNLPKQLQRLSLSRSRAPASPR